MADLSEFEMLDVPDVMRVLRLSRTMVYDLLRAGKLPGIRIGATWRIPVSDFRRYLESSRVTSPSEATAD
jgi:excisionase family DNA binding protein